MTSEQQAKLAGLAALKSDLAAIYLGLGIGISRWSIDGNPDQR